MILTLTRKDFTSEGIFSELTDSTGKLSLYTLEHSYNNKPKLYNGTFNCVRGTHRLHNNIPFITFEITGVAGHTGVLFHIGNYNNDSDGCVLLGMERTGNMVTHSTIAFSKFMALLGNAQSFDLIVTS